MSILRDWCLVCKNHTEIPEELKRIAEQLQREYKYIIYCTIQKTLIVANEDMYINKRETCPDFKE